MDHPCPCHYVIARSYSHLDTDPDLPVGGEGAAEEHPAPLVPRTLVRSPHLPVVGTGGISISIMHY